MYATLPLFPKRLFPREIHFCVAVKTVIYADNELCTKYFDLFIVVLVIIQGA